MTRIDRHQTRQTTPERNSSPAPRTRLGQHRERDFGIGYGSSSGYGCTRRYASEWIGAPRFRCS